MEPLAARLRPRRLDQFFGQPHLLAPGKPLRRAIEADRLLFVDEVHRFNKAQQDAFLPYLEDGTLTLIGATTENPSFELNSALLSRARVYVLKPLQAVEVRGVIDRALSDEEHGLGRRRLAFSEPLRDRLAVVADGDARRALNLLEVLADLAEPAGDREVIDPVHLEEILSGEVRRFDKGAALSGRRFGSLQIQAHAASRKGHSAYCER